MLGTMTIIRYIMWLRSYQVIETPQIESRDPLKRHLETRRRSFLESLDIEQT